MKDASKPSSAGHEQAPLPGQPSPANQLEGQTPSENAKGVEVPARTGAQGGTPPMPEVPSSEPQRKTGSGDGKPPRRKGRRVAIIALSVVLALVVGCGIALFTVYNIMANRVSGAETEAGTTPEEVKTPEAQQATSVSFLVAGIKYDTENGQEDTIGNTDMLLYVYYNLERNRMSILQMPRDAYVGDDLATGGTYKINGLYRNAPDTNNRMAAVSTVFKNQFGLPVDFYVTIDMNALREIVDIKGWIETYVPMTISDPEHPEARIEAGWQNLTGEQVEFLLRNRKSPNYNDQGDIARLRTQQYFYAALFREFKSLALTDMPMWLDVFTYRCKTDADLFGMLLGKQMAVKMLSLEGKDITFVRPPCGPVTYNGQSVITLLPEETAEVLNAYFRPAGDIVPLDALDIHSLPLSETLGYVDAEIKTMGDVEASQPPLEGLAG